MNSTIDSTQIPAISLSAQESLPHTIVLQPNGNLDHASSQHFQQSLEEALELATETVIVDLLWIKTTDADGVAALVAGVERASTLGKTISFQAMNHTTRMAMETAWERLRDIRLGSWSSLFGSDLEHFLDNLDW